METTSGKDLVMLFTYFPAVEKRAMLLAKVQEHTVNKDIAVRTNLIDGGVPAGTKIPPDEEGCRRTRSRIRTITRHGNSNTKPNGIEIVEFLFNRILRLKKANLGSMRPFSRGGSSSGRLGAEGSRFEIRWMNPISTVGVW